MVYLKKYSKSDVYMSPAGTVMDAAAVASQFPAASRFTHVVETDAAGQVMYGFYNLASMCSKYGVDHTLPADAAVEALSLAMQAQKDAQAEAAKVPSAEERIAAMMEYQALTTMNDA